MPRSQNCVLLFSGGRDSSLAAIRLAPQFERVHLVTIASAHMTGLDNVEKRVAELQAKLPSGSQWLLYEEDGTFDQELGRTEKSCISCHFGYFAVAFGLAQQLGTDVIAAGFVDYQNTWVEQTPYAIFQLQTVLKAHGKILLLPVADVASKDAVMQELSDNGLVTSSLELKCLRQKGDPGLRDEELREAVNKWASNLSATLKSASRLTRQPLKIITFDARGEC